MQPFPDPTDTSLSHEERLLAAGALILAGDGTAEDGRAAIARLLSTQAVVDRAGLERTHLYRSFPPEHSKEQSHDRFVRDVVGYALREKFLFDAGAIEAVGDDLGLSAPSPDDALEDVRELARAEFTGGTMSSGEISIDMGFRSALSLWALDGDDELVQKGLRDAYGAGTAMAANYYVRILDAWGCALVDPYTTDDVAVLLTALVDGMLLRSRFDPESADPGGELFASAVATFISAIIRPKGEPGVSASDRFAIIKTAADRHASDGGDPDEAGMSARICDAAVAAYQTAEDKGLDPRSVQLADIATRADCSTTTVERHWGGPSLLLIEYFYREIDQYALPVTGLPLGESIDRLAVGAVATLEEPQSVERDAEFLRMIGRMLFETARFGGERPLLAGAALPTIEFGGPDGSRAHLRNERDVRLRRSSIASRFERVIDAGQRSGVLRDERGLDAPDLGNLLPVTALHQAIRRESSKAREVAEMVYETILRGLVSDLTTFPSAREATRQPIPEPDSSRE